MLKNLTIFTTLFILIFANQALARKKPHAAPATPAPAEAAPSTAVTPVVSPVMGGMPPALLALQAGRYEFNNESAVIQDVLRINQNVTDKDFEYFKEVQNTIHTEFADWTNSAVFDQAHGLYTLSQKSTVAQKFTPAEQFIDAVGLFTRKKQILESKIKSLTSIADTLPSRIDISGNAAVPARSTQGYGNINFQKLVDYYTGQVNEITTYVSNLGHMILLPNQEIPLTIEANSGKGLSLEGVKNVYSDSQLRDWQYQIKKWRSWPSKSQRVRSDYTAFFREKIRNFIRDYGTTERYRFHDANQQTGAGISYREEKEREAKLIVDAFWTRSYLRAFYGVSICSIGIVPPAKRWANVEFLTAATETLGQFREEPTCEENEFIPQAQAMERALDLADGRTKKIFKGDASFLRRIASAGTLLMGKGEAADSIKSMLMLLAADITEERMIQRAGGREQMMAYYKERYNVSEEVKEHNRMLIASYDPNFAQAIAKKDPAMAKTLEKLHKGGGDSKLVEADSLRGQMQKLIFEIKLIKTNLARADELEIRLNALMDFGNSADFNNDVDSATDLLK